MTQSEWMRQLGVCAALLAGNVPLAQALDIELGAGISSEYTTNIFRADDNRQDELIGSVWSGISLSEESPTLSAQVAAAGELQTYVNDTVGDDVLFSLASLVDWTISPQRLIWHFEDYFQQVRTSPLEPVGPDNRQDSNVLWTGPDLFLRLAKLYTIQLGARYGDYYYGETGGDNTRVAASLRANRRLTPLSDLYVDVEQTRVEYDQREVPDLDIPGAAVPNADYDRTDLFGGWAYETVLTDLRVELGQTQILRDGLPDVEGFLGGVSINRRLAREGFISGQIRYRFAEGSSNLLSSGGGRLGVAYSDTAVTEDIAYEELIELLYGGQWGPARVELQLLRRDEDFELSVLDRLTYGAGLTAGFPLAPSWRAGAFIDYRRRDYLQLGRQDDDLSVGGGVNYLLSRRLTLALDLRHNLRDSTIASADFNETIALISLRYGERPTWSLRRY
jgi:hypothetical protein